ncbi:MAG: uracil-DNA glycosylase [bacterium]
MEWPEILLDLEAALERLAGDGVEFLNVQGYEQPDRAAGRQPSAGEPAGARAPQSPPATASPPGAAGANQALDRLRRKGATASGAVTSGSVTSGAVAPHDPAGKGVAPTPPTAAGAGAGTDADPGAGLAALAARYSDCRNCKLGSTRTRLVFGAGHPNPAILFIGEGPGQEEDRQGLPFVGRAGALLTGLIAALGLTRADVYITNVVKCRPPQNRNPEPEEIAACDTVLRQQIQLLDPRLIVTLGNVPLKALKPGAGGITRERGNVFHYQSWPVLPTFHPSYLLRTFSALADCWRDFREAFRLGYPRSPG